MLEGRRVLVLQVRRLEKAIEQRTALSIEQLDVVPGEVVAVIGPVGSGKSLLVRLLAGEIVPSGGTILLDGEDVSLKPAVRARIGVLFEDDLLYKRMSALENLEFACQMRGLRRGCAAEMLVRVGLADQMREPLHKLAKTMQRRVAFGRALLGAPALLLLDCPSRRTDLDTRALFARLVGEVAANGAAVLVTEDDLSWIGTRCTRVVELEGGRVVATYAPGADGGGGGSGSGSAGGDSSAAPTPPEHFVPFRIPARKEDRIVLYDPGELLYATSRDGQTVLRTAREEAVASLTLQELEERLAGRGFFRAHRAYLVNLQHIKAVIQFTRNSYTLQLADGQDTMIPLSKQSEKELQALLGY